MLFKFCNSTAIRSILDYILDRQTAEHSKDLYTIYSVTQSYANSF